jgi:hypothetical protein
VPFLKLVIASERGSKARAAIGELVFHQRGSPMMSSELGTSERDLISVTTHFENRTIHC